MVLAHWVKIETTMSLLIVGTIIGTSMFFSFVAAQREKRREQREKAHLGKTRS
jgi:hypothetical protein